MKVARSFFLLTLLLLSPMVFADDYFLIIGGGPSADLSQVSIEHNVKFALSVAKRTNWPAKQIVHFASGEGSALDVCEVLDAQKHRAHVLLRQLFDRGNFGPISDLLDYRHHGIDTKLVSSKQSVTDQLRTLASQVTERDRVIIYVTGHGSKGRPVENGVMDLWKNERLTVQEFTTLLDAFPVQTNVLVVMVQCYSGSFANLIYYGGDKARGLAPHRRAGFFATNESRPAAGCTPDAKIENYKEYSTYFWAAIGGVDRLGNPVKPIDINQDGVIDMGEAHAYTQINSVTVDVSMRTSDLLLRNATPSAPIAGGQPLLSTDASLDEILLLAQPNEKLVLTRLSEELKLAGADALPSARKQAKERNPDRPAVPRANPGAPRGTPFRARDAVSRDMLARWPFLRSGWHPKTQELLYSNSKEVISTLEKHPEFANWQASVKRAGDRQSEQLDRERRWAKLQRFIQTCEAVIQRENLNRAGDEFTKQKLKDLELLERSALLVR